jgi:hypothetical protein
MILKCIVMKKIILDSSFQTGRYQFMPLVLASIFFFFLFCSTGVWTQGLHLEPLHQPFFVKRFFEIGSCELFIYLGWLQTAILLISASWVARITGVSHQHPAFRSFWYAVRDCKSRERVHETPDMNSLIHSFPQAPYFSRAWQHVIQIPLLSGIFLSSETLTVMFSSRVPMYITVVFYIFSLLSFTTQSVIRLLWESRCSPWVSKHCVLPKKVKCKCMVSFVAILNSAVS